MYLQQLKLNNSMKTAVEYLYENYLDNPLSNEDIIYNINVFEQAKEIEKQQIINFTNEFINKHTFGDYDSRVQENKTIEEYYNETFKNKNNENTTI